MINFFMGKHFNNVSLYKRAKSSNNFMAFSLKEKHFIIINGDYLFGTIVKLCLIFFIIFLLVFQILLILMYKIPPPIESSSFKWRGEINLAGYFKSMYISIYTYIFCFNFKFHNETILININNNNINLIKRNKTTVQKTILKKTVFYYFFFTYFLFIF